MMPPQRNYNREMELLRWESELKRMNHQWREDKESFTTTGLLGRRSLPGSCPKTVLFGGVAVGLCACLHGLYEVIQTRGFSVALHWGVSAIAATLIVVVKAQVKLRRYEDAKAHYETQRAQHLQRKPQ